MPARLLWRLLVVPRLVLAVGVIIFATLAVLLPRRRQQRGPVRRPPTSEDPVAAALMDAQPVSRFGGDELDADDLRWIISVNELDDDERHNVVISLYDEVWSYADVVADGLEDALAEQPDVDAVEVDRDGILVHSMLSLPDVHAATIRALLSINGSPRLTRHRLPRYRPLPPSAMSTVADGVAAIMSEHGFVGRLRMSLEHAEPRDDLPGPGFYRVFEADRLVQVVRLRNDYGYHDGGRIVDGQLRLTVEVIEIATGDAAESIALEHGCEVITGEGILLASYRGAATVDGIEHVLVSQALPLCDATTSKAAIVDRWVIGLPWHVPDRLRWEAADIAARWGFRGHARDLNRRRRRLT